MKLLLTFLTALISLISNGQQNHFDAGNTAYSIGDYNTALSEYNKAVGADIFSEALFYNLGNTYYKLEEYGEAIWAYEKAIRLDPNSENARFNLALVNEKIVKDVSISEGGIADWLKINLFGFHINFWGFCHFIF